MKNSRIAKEILQYESDASENWHLVEFCDHWISAKDNKALVHGHSVSTKGVGIVLHSHIKLQQER